MSRQQIALRLIASALLGLAAGVATSYLQGILPGALNTLANSGTVWSVVAFGIAVAILPAHPAVVVAATLALLGEVAGYYAIATPLRGYTASLAEQVLWTTAALVIGPVIGFAALWWSSDQPWRRLAAAAVICGILLGEGLHGIVRIERDGPQWWTEVVLGVGLGALLIRRGGRTARQWAIGVVATAAVTLAIFLVYGGADRFFTLLS